MKNKTQLLNVFMSEIDSSAFIEYLKQNNAVCINIKPEKNKEIALVEKIHLTKKVENTSYVILNTMIQTLDEYKNNVSLSAGYYHYAQTGHGVIQFLPCYLSKYNPGCLTIGRLAASYDDEATEKWVKSIFTWIRKTGKKVYRTSFTRNITSDEPEKKTVAFPTATEVFTGNNGVFLTLGKDIYCIAK